MSNVKMEQTKVSVAFDSRCITPRTGCDIGGDLIGNSYDDPACVWFDYDGIKHALPKSSLGNLMEKFPSESKMESAVPVPVPTTITQSAMRQKSKEFISSINLSHNEHHVSVGWFNEEYHNDFIEKFIDFIFYDESKRERRKLFNQLKKEFGDE
jgi:hypothetical protein